MFPTPSHTNSVKNAALSKTETAAPETTVAEPDVVAKRAEPTTNEPKHEHGVTEESINKMLSEDPSVPAVLALNLI